jgi:hypothetical protein
MEERFRMWLIDHGYSETGAAYSYSRAIPTLSTHYSTETGAAADIFAITDQAKISTIAHDYSQQGRFSDFGYQQHGRFRAAIARYSEFFVHAHHVEDSNAEDTEIEVTQSEQVQPNLTANFAYERDLQTTLCAQIAGLFPNHKIYGESNLGIEYSIAGKRIDVLLEHIESKDLLIVELKSGRADYKVFGQISMYLGLAIREFPERSIKGVIVAGNIDDSLRYACETNSEITVKLYRMSLELEDAG